MRKAIAVLGIAAIAVTLCGAVVLAKEPARPAEKPIYTPQQLLDKANALRADKGVVPLKLDERLNKSAQMKADDFKANNYYGHKNPVTNVRGVDIIINTTGESCVYVSENINESEIGYDPFHPIDGWPTSKSHYEALIDQRYDITGFGYSERDGKGYYTQHFCDLK